MTAIFSVQDETGTVTQISLQPSPSPSLIISIGDTGVYAGYPDDGTAGYTAPVFNELPFLVTQVIDNEHFSIETTKANMADWPAGGVITWLTGMNMGETSVVFEIDGANAYISEIEFAKYHQARGNAVPVGATIEQIRAAIVKATDYLDAKFRFAGTKLLQSYGVGGGGVYYSNTGWVVPYGYGAGYMTSSTSTQSTEWPRRGVLNFNGDSVYGIPKAIKAATAELAIRVLNGVNLQPDYDPNLVAAGGVASSITKKVGPLETSITYDTKFGLGFFASFPVVDRLLQQSGLLMQGGSRTVFR